MEENTAYDYDRAQPPCKDGAVEHLEGEGERQCAGDKSEKQEMEW